MELDQKIARLEEQLRAVETYSVKAFWLALDRSYEALLPHRPLRCIVCDHRDQRPGFKVLTDECRFGGGTLERYQCPHCDAIFGPQKYLDLDESFVAADYELLYSRYAEADSTDAEIRTFRCLTPRPGLLYLNWGCGAWSKSIPALRQEGYEVWGFEPSVAKSEGVVVKTRSEISASFDGIFSNNVIEHFRDPVAQFRDFRAILKPGGVMAHSSPCYEYSYSFTRFHTLFLLGRSPHVLAERTGFNAEHVASDGEYISYRFTAA